MILGNRRDSDLLLLLPIQLSHRHSKFVIGVMVRVGDVSALRFETSSTPEFENVLYQMNDLRVSKLGFASCLTHIKKWKGTLLSCLLSAF